MVSNQFTQRPLPPELAKDDARRARRAPPPHTAVPVWPGSRQSPPYGHTTKRHPQPCMAEDGARRARRALPLHTAGLEWPGAQQSPPCGHTPTRHPQPCMAPPGSHASSPKTKGCHSATADSEARTHVIPRARHPSLPWEAPHPFPTSRSVLAAQNRRGGIVFVRPVLLIKKDPILPTRKQDRDEAIYSGEVQTRCLVRLQEKGGRDHPDREVRVGASTQSAWRSDSPQ